MSVWICKCKMRQPEQVYLYTDAHLYCSVHASVPVYTVYMVYTVYIVYKVYMVYTVYTLNTMYTVYSSNCSVSQAMSLSTRERFRDFNKEINTKKKGKQLNHKTWSVIIALNRWQHMARAHS